MPEYHFEQGPIRPPSEAASLLLRVSRNCAWNRCTFCPLYKGQKFTLRPVADVVRDMETVARNVDRLRELQVSTAGESFKQRVRALYYQLPEAERPAMLASIRWFEQGMTGIFLQDADALLGGTRRLLPILDALQRCFPWRPRLTCYSRSATVLRFSVQELQQLARRGLDRLHLGLESGCDEVLQAVAKGATGGLHIQAGQRIKAAGIELCVYLMPGLGGTALSTPHALESAAAINAINPDFVRLRTLAVVAGTPLDTAWLAGQFEWCDSLTLVRELLTFFNALGDIQSRIESDHALNLFEDLAGVWPQDGPRIKAMLQRFLDLDSQTRTLYLLGRRCGQFRGLGDLEDVERMAAVRKLADESDITPENIEEVCRELTRRMI
jgi:hypothetical protein